MGSQASPWWPPSVNAPHSRGGLEVGLMSLLASRTRGGDGSRENKEKLGAPGTSGSQQSGTQKKSSREGWGGE